VRTQQFYCKLSERIHLRNVGLEGMIILKWILKISMEYFGLDLFTRASQMKTLNIFIS